MSQVMVVDMLEGFSRIGPLASPRVDALVPEQAECLRSLPRGSLVVFTGDSHEPDDFELRRFPPHCLRGTREAEIRPELLDAARASGARVEIIRKRSFSAFYQTNLDAIVGAAPARSWVVFGCVTDCCIETAVSDLVIRGYEVTVVRNLIDTWDLTPDETRKAGRTEAFVHPADSINDEWFTRRLPAIWGVKVVADWRQVWGRR